MMTEGWRCRQIPISFLTSITDASKDFCTLTICQSELLHTVNYLNLLVNPTLLCPGRIYHKCHENLLHLKCKWHFMWRKFANHKMVRAIVEGQRAISWYQISLVLSLQRCDEASCVDQCCTGIEVNACYQYTKSIWDQYRNWIKRWENIWILELVFGSIPYCY